MDRYFTWYGVPEDRRVEFASLKLIGTAQLFWESVEDLLERRHALPVGSWEEMKRRLQEKYLPQSYRGNLLDQWNALTQGNRPVTEYVTQFDELRMRCHVVEDEAMTLSRFRQGLKDDLRRELVLRGVTTLDHAYSLVRDYESVMRTPYVRRGDNRPSITPAPTLSSKSLLGPPPSNVSPAWENKDKSPETPRTSSRLQCFKCKGFGHISSNCPSRTLVIEEHEGTVDESLEDQVYEPKLEEFGDLGDDEDAFLGCIRTLPVGLGSMPFVPDTLRLSVVRCTLTQPKDTDDWRRHAIFHTYIKINDKGCKIIVDSGSCINAVSVATVSRLRLKPVLHPQPYSVSWVDTSSIAIKERCLVPIQFLEYKDHIWCDVIPMDVGHIILGRPWLFDLDVTIHGRSNSCSFVFNGKKIHLNPLPPKPVGLQQTKKIVERKGLNIISPTECEHTHVGNYVVFVVVVMEVQDNLRDWALILPTTHFARNISVNRSLGMGPFEVVHGYNPRKLLDPILMSLHASVSASIKAFVQHFHDSHIEINKQHEASNASYKLRVDLRIEDYVVIRIRLKRRPPGSVPKLQARSAGPFKILKHVDPNAHVIDLPSHFGCHSTFNAEDLVAYKGHFNSSNDLFLPPFVNLDLDFDLDPFVIPTPIPSITAHKDKIDAILDEQMVLTNDGEVQRFLVRRVDPRETLQQLDSNLLELYQSQLDLPLPGSPSTRSESVDGDTRFRPPLIRVYGRWKKLAQPLSLWLDD
ncbi:uncharacterized protein LOC108983558 [Juglans regia]|uniref:Uncharacterized protein LOC108983558 n=1 Tax=Juglans regia TaxID=51240 RepID=A0A6P9DYD6_JUGRE|nr:uncharacterized protein LOC108983558 [Juglans regia]XP_035540117.1 uncharacterized protein LOC108983558 [Juglans regia]XP_035540118.1 uncharacterized protein LOC108983558 [Juglans regia]XP_035540120.1 uncharacterized protein LOC108983558 [Juglans regia]XP_035540121.1 uncharacterized protein LOC108983558 [Juglans regia]